MQYIYDDRAWVYRKSGDLLATIASQHHKLTIDEVTHERWCELMGLMREVDTWLDDTAVSSDEVMQELRDFTQFKALYPELDAAAIGADVHERMVGRVAIVAAAGAQIATTQNIDEFIQLRTLEAFETVNCVGDAATTAVREQPAFEEKFLPTMRALGAAATLFDSLIDARQDCHEGKQQIEPTTQYYVAVARAMKEQGKQGYQALLRPSVVNQIARKGIARSLNRARHGMTPYSNANFLHPQRTV